MGYSLGSVPCLYAASKYNFKSLILIAPLDFGIKIENEKLKNSTCELKKIESFRSIGKISEISSPIFLIHGKLDNKVSINHSYEILSQVKNANFWFPKKGDHNNIFTLYRRKFYEILNVFTEKVNIIHTETTKLYSNCSDDYFGNEDNDENYINNENQFIVFNKNIKNDYNDISKPAKLLMYNINKMNDRYENNLMSDKDHNNLNFCKLEEEKDELSDSLSKYEIKEKSNLCIIS